MGYDEFDRALLNAWRRAHDQVKDDPAKLAAILRRRGMATYTRPLRSWSLVLRANDKRIDDKNTMALVRMGGAEVRRLCSSVKIDEPGVSLDEAARLFGVNRTTVSRWADPPPENHTPKRGTREKTATWWQDVQRQMHAFDGPERYRPSTYRVEGRRLVLEHIVNRANVKRSVTRVWTPRFYGLDPGGEVWSGDWGEMWVGLAQKVGDGFMQQLQRVDRRLGEPGRGASPATRVWQWVCPEVDGGCGRLVYKLYLPMQCGTLVKRLRGDRREDVFENSLLGSFGEADCAGFLCLRCAGLVYESSERGARPGWRRDGSRRRVDVRDRLLKRMSGGVLGRGDVFTDS